MRFNSVIYMLLHADNQDKLGNSIENTVPDEGRKVFAEKKSVQQSEFYQAAVTGLKPTLVFVIWSKEFQDEPRIKYNGKIYSIIRTFERPCGKIELHCEVKAGG